MGQEYLRDGYIRSLKHKSKRYDVTDADLPYFGVRVGARTKKFVFIARMGNSKHAVRRTIGVFCEFGPAEKGNEDEESAAPGEPGARKDGKARLLTTDEARALALSWKRLHTMGLDPDEEEQRQRRAAQEKTRSTFKSVMEDYLAALPQRTRNRSVDKDEAFIRRNIINPDTNHWMELPISEVKDFHISALVGTVAARGAPGQALKILQSVRTFYVWAMVPHRRVAIGLDRNPVADLTPRSLNMFKSSRSRHFMYEEIRAYLHASAAVPYPWGPFQRALIETGQRRGDVAKMRWSHIDFDSKLWTIPAASGKADEDHHVPLSDAMIEMLRSLQSQQSEFHADFVFSSSNGQRPLTNFSREKSTFDARFEGEFKKLAPTKQLRPWVWHDVRRTLRTHFSAFAIDEVAETAIGHGKRGIQRVYNLFKYRRQVRAAFNTWSTHLRMIADGTANPADFDHEEPMQ